MVAELHLAHDKGDLMLRAIVALILLALPLAGAAAQAPASPAPAVLPASSVTDNNSPTAAPPVEALVQEALERSPAIAAARAQVAARRQMEQPAGALPDPMVEVMLQNAGLKPTVGDEEMSMVGPEVRQGLPYPGKRSAARKVAVAETAAAEAALHALERQVAADVATLFGRIYALDRERETITAARQLVDLLTVTARTRYTAGETEQEAVIKAQVQALRLDEQLADLGRERAAMVAELNRWLDRPGSSPLGVVRAVPESAAVLEDAPEVAARGSAEVARAAANVATAERRVDVARLDLKPNFSAGAGLGYRGSMDPVVTARFGVELPFWRRQKQIPLLRAAEQEREMASKELADAQAMASAEGARLLAEWQTADAQVRLYRDGIVPRTSDALDAARSSYLAGRADFSTVIEDFNLWLEARMQLARREADRFAASAGFARLAGASTAPPTSGSTP